MGGANNICSDKTGTLTKNQMTWTQIWSGGDHKINNPDGALTDLLQTDQFCDKTTMQLLGEAVSTNTMDTLENSGATEKAMLKFIVRCGVDYQQLRKSLLYPNYTRFQFDSARKRMSTVVELANG
jgi:magnesium-transporting ATPase (P-type)